ncbi:MAG TPA: DinB family protein [Bryobacteraceae bacterium]|nr:DinB family protein [Bryobacteraceae bacterium]HUO32220.1 DinB family protein [Bryobacteraceae bacterium]
MRSCYSILFIAALGSAGALVAQESNPLSNELKQNYEMRKKALLAEAEKMPDADYSFKPTPEVRPFGGNVAHVADAQMMICSAVKGERKMADTKGKTSKADLFAALKASFDYCDGAYDSLTDASATQDVKIFGHPETKLSALWGNLVHDNEMYGYMAVYLRLKNQVPPTSERRGH